MVRYLIDMKPALHDVSGLYYVIYHSSGLYLDDDYMWVTDSCDSKIFDESILGVISSILNGTYDGVGKRRSLLKLKVNTYMMIDSLSMLDVYSVPIVDDDCCFVGSERLM